MRTWAPWEGDGDDTPTIYAHFLYPPGDGERIAFYGPAEAPQDPQIVSEQVAALLNEREARIAALEAENARLREASRPRPMSEDGPERVLLVRNDGTIVTGQGPYNGSRVIDDVSRRIQAPTCYRGWLPLPEVHGAFTPDAPLSPVPSTTP